MSTASSDLATPQTTISGEYSHSNALTLANSPEAVGYPYRQEDYCMVHSNSPNL